MLRVVLASLTLSGCYLAHGGAPVLDPPDAAARPDAARLDAAQPDAGPPGCAFALEDRRALAWIPESESCSYFAHPRAVSHGAGVALVASEQRICRDREPFALAALATVRSGRLAIPDLVVSIPHDGTVAPAAEAAGRLGIATGLTLRTFDADLVHVATAELAEPPASVPGCPMSLRTVQLAGSGRRWLAISDWFECDVSGWVLSTHALDGGAPQELLRTYEPIAGAAAAGDGFAWVSRPRGDRPVSRLWRTYGGMARPETEIEVEGTAAAIVAGPEPGQVVLLYARVDAEAIVRLTVHLLDGDDVEQARYELEPFAMPAGGFEVADLAATRTRFGLVAAVTLAWTGGAIHGGLAVVALDDAGAVLGRFEEFHEAGAGGTASVAALGDSVIVHHDVNDHRTTEALLFGCR